MTDQLKVEYKIVSTKAEAALNRISNKLKQVEVFAEEQGKSIVGSFKANTAAFLAFGAVAVGTLYSIIRASSYAAMYSDSFAQSLTRVSNAILEMTGLDKAITDLLKKFDEFSQALAADRLREWVKNLSLLDGILLTIAVSVGIVLTALLLVGGAVLTWGLLVSTSAAIVAGLATIGVAVGTVILVLAAVAGAIIGLIVVWILWKTGVLTALVDLGARFGIWLKNLHVKFKLWVIGLKDSFRNWITTTKEKLSNFKTWLGEKFDSAWEYIKSGLSGLKDSFFSTIDSIIGKIAGLITKIKSIPSSFGGSNSKGVYKTKSSTTRTSGFASGAHVYETGVATVHAGEDIINLRRLLSGIRTGQTGAQNTTTNNITVNVSGGGTSMFDQNRTADIVSKKIASELSRIGTSI